MSIVSQGLPSSFFSGPRAVLAGLTIGIVVVAGFSGWAWMKNRATEPTTAPACYGADEAYVPSNETMPLVGARDRNGVPNNQRRDGPHVLERVIAAEKACRPGACTKEAWSEYRSAIFWYLSPRLQQTRMLDRTYGDNGLRLARRMFSEPIDAQIEKGLRERYQAKLFRINDSRENRDVMAILIFKGGEALRPCRKGDPGT